MKRAPLLLAVLVASGCVQGVTRKAPRELFPSGAFGEEALGGACPLQVQSFRTARDAGPDGITPTVGGHPRLTILDVRERSPDVEVVAVQVDAQPRTLQEAVHFGEDEDPDPEKWRYSLPRDRLLVGIANEDDFHNMSVWLDGSPEISVRVLLRRKVMGGLFDSLSYCFEGYATVVAAPNASYGRIVIDTPDEHVSGWVSLEMY